MPYQDPAKLPVDDNQIPGFTQTPKVNPDMTATQTLGTLQDILDKLEEVSDNLNEMVGYDTKQAVRQSGKRPRGKR